MVNTLSLSDAEKKTAFLATLQGYPLRMMSGMAGNPQFTFADLVTEFLALYGRDDRGAEDALNRAAREDRQEKEESIFRDRSMLWLWELEKTSTSQLLSVCFWMA